MQMIQSEPQEPRIDTARTIMMLVQPCHAEALLRFHLDNREHLAKWEPLREDRFYTLQATQQRIEQMRCAYRAHQAIHLIAFDRDNGNIIALCNFTNIVRGVFQACHVGYAIDHHHEGQGLMHEVMQAGMAYLFEVIGLHRIMANTMPANQRSLRLLQRLGFVREGYAHAYLKIAGKWEDHVLTARINSCN